jgi:hypothetical protein
MKGTSHGSLSQSGNTEDVPERSHLQRLAALERDAAVARAARMRRWTIAGTAALTGAFAGVVAVIAPGKSLGAKRTAAPSAPAAATTSSSSSSASPMPALASPSQLGLQGPDQAPQSDPAPAAPAQSAPAQPAPAQSAPAQSAPAQSAPAPAPAPSDSGGPVVSGGS